MERREGSGSEELSSSSSSSSSSMSSPSSSSDGTPLRPIFCLNRNVDMKKFEEIEDCFILDFDPYFDSLNLAITELSLSSSPPSDDLSVIAQKGQVACRDYPHSRHLCLKYPFGTTPHETYCELCYCYVCDSAAPCKDWNKDSKTGHCHASDRIGNWKSKRKLMRKEKQPSSQN